MQTSAKLNSKILSKSTNEIVNTFVGEMYREMPYTFQNEMQRIKMDATPSKYEYHPITTEGSRMHNRQRLIKLKLEPSDNDFTGKIRKKTDGRISKKLVKCNSSDMRCSRSYSSNSSHSYLPAPKSSIMKNMLKERYETTVKSVQEAMKVSDQMHTDLVAIDRLLKNLIGIERRVKVENSRLPLGYKKLCGDKKPAPITNKLKLGYIEKDSQFSSKRYSPQLPKDIIAAERYHKERPPKPYDISENMNRIKRTAFTSKKFYDLQREFPQRNYKQELSCKRQFCSSIKRKIEVSQKISNTFDLAKLLHTIDDYKQQKSKLDRPFPNATYS